MRTYTPPALLSLSGAVDQGAVAAAVAVIAAVALWLWLWVY